MKRLQRLLKGLTLGLTLAAFSTTAAQAQCPYPTGTTAYGTATASSTNCSAVAPTSSCHYFDEYVTFSGLVVGNSYTVYSYTSADATNSPFTLGVYTSTSSGTTPIAFATAAAPTAAAPMSATFTATTTTVYAKNFFGSCGSTLDECNYFSITNNSATAPAASTTTQPSTTSVNGGATNVQVLRLNVPVCSQGGTITSLTFGTTGSTAPATDISAARVYFTLSTTFATTTQFGTAVANPNGSFTVTGSQAIPGGATGYFWLVYDLTCTAIVANVIDAEITSYTLDGVTAAPATTNPSGTRSITALYATTRSDANSTTAVTAGSTNRAFAYANVAGSSSCPGTVTSVSFNVTAVSGQIATATAYYSTSSTFDPATAIVFGTPVSNPVTGTYTFTGSQSLGAGSNYFFLVYDIPCAPSATTAINANPQSLVVNGSTVNVTGTAPSANAITLTNTAAKTDPNATTAVTIGTQDVRAVRISIPATSPNCPANITSLTASVNGTATSSDIDRAEVYYTTSTTFSTATPFGTAVVNPSGTITFTGSQPLSTTNTNYLWLVYDVNCNATIGNTLNADITSVTFGSNVVTPTGTAPAANTISGPTATRTSTIASNVQAGSTFPVLYVQVAGLGGTCPSSVTALNISMGGTAVPADVVSVQAYYTTSATLNTNTPFGAPVAFASGATATITGNQPLASGTGNYFFLVYTLSSGATVGNTVTGNITSVVHSASATPSTPTGSAPGSATIIAPLAGDAICSAPTAILGSSATNSYDIAGRTLEPNEVAPITNSQGTGSGRGNYSWGTASSSTYWYKLVVPTTGYGSSGNLFIWANTTSASSSTDAQIALWSLPNMPATCTAGPDFTGARLLAANDDEIVTAQSPTNTLNSAMRVNLVPGNTYYIQIDGYNTNTPAGNLYVEDLSQAPYNLANNGLGDYYNPTGKDSSFAAYEVNSADGWTLYYNNGGTSTVLTDDSLLMAINWGVGFAYNGVYSATSVMANHLRRDPRTTTAPPSNGTLGSTAGDNITVWVGRAASAVSSDLKTTAPYFVNFAGAPYWYMMTKYWSVVPTNQPSVPTPVRTYYSTADFNDLQSAITAAGGTLGNPSEMRCLKFTKSATTHYTVAEQNPANTGHSTIAAGTAFDLAWNNSSVSPTINQAEFTVATFSGGGLGSTGVAGVSPLPVNFTAVTARNEGRRNRIDWTVGEETQLAGYEVEKQINSEFKVLGKLPAAAKAAYAFYDEQPNTGRNLYRIKAVNLYGSHAYSSTVMVLMKDAEFNLAVFPNPTQDVVTVRANTADAATVTVTDLSGRILLRQDVNGGEAQLNLRSLAAGTYLLLWNDGTHQETIRVTRQ